MNVQFLTAKISFASVQLRSIIVRKCTYIDKVHLKFLVS